METRVANWPDVLAAKIEEWRARPFEWGIADCCIFVADITHAITGCDRRALFPPYTSEEEALILLSQNDGMHGILCAAFGEAKPVARAHRGDPIAAELTYGLTAGICLGLNSCAMDRTGLSFFPTSRACAAWSA